MKIKKKEGGQVEVEELTSEQKDFHYNFWIKAAKDLEDEMDFADKWITDPEVRVPEQIAMIIVRSSEFYQKKIELYKRYALEKGERHS
jgi:hypothetical protein